jgi:hypothetical protein
MTEVICCTAAETSFQSGLRRCWLHTDQAACGRTEGADLFQSLLSGLLQGHELREELFGSLAALVGQSDLDEP